MEGKHILGLRMERRYLFDAAGFIIIIKVHLRIRQYINTIKNRPKEGYVIASHVCIHKMGIYFNQLANMRVYAKTRVQNGGYYF